MHSYLYHRVKDLWPQAIGWDTNSGDFFSRTPQKNAIDILVYESEQAYDLQFGQVPRCVAIGYAGGQLTVSGDAVIVEYLKNLPLLHDRPICYFEAAVEHSGSPVPSIESVLGPVAAVEHSAT